MLRPTLLLLAAAALGACATNSTVFVTKNSHQVARLAPDRFEVFAQPGTGAPDYFCAAGDYAFFRLGASGSDRVIVTRPNGPSSTRPGSRSMEFRIIDFDQGPRTPRIVLSMSDRGENLPIAHARLLCRGRTDFHRLDD